LLVNEPGIIEKKMFDGLAYMVHGNMALEIVGQDLMLFLGGGTLQRCPVSAARADNGLL